MDDNLADYRRFCANRLKRLERCKKTKSFCNLDDEIPYPLASSGSDLMLRESGIFASHGGNMTFSRCSENTVLSSVKSETIPFCLGTNTFCSGSKTPPMTNSPHFGSTGAFSINVTSSTTEANPTKNLSVANSYRKVTSDFVQTNNNDHLPPPAYLSPYSSLTITLSTVSSQSSILSTKKPESVTKTTITGVNNSTDCSDSSRRAQRNFELLREKMVRFAVFHMISRIFRILLLLLSSIRIRAFLIFMLAQA
ncbi:hypothetical protein WUBG_03309 [Wuchereria bancrofti]|uniref:Uncharacterized protein n=1 Tax=Wuchereria bancrofti TaxID=6293 RepID=J9EUC9_WUCBA|nr:hypothetical protein WUBG_03309 [Wuchereria bancrofti]